MLGESISGTRKTPPPPCKKKASFAPSSRCYYASVVDMGTHFFVLESHDTTEPAKGNDAPETTASSRLASVIVVNLTA